MNEGLDNLNLAQKIVKTTEFFLLLGYLESILCCMYLSINIVLRAEDHQKLAIEGFKRAKSDIMVTAARNQLSDARHLHLWINSFKSYYNKK